MRRAAAALALACAAALPASGCFGDDDQASPRKSDRPAAESGPSTRSERPPQEGEPRPRSGPGAGDRLEPSRCPADLSNCKTASGRIVYVERVDPDGDGDAHFVLASRQAITLPGLSVIDVKKSLRPHPLPGPGDRISAAGPVYRGSYGQKQIEAIELHVARAR